MTIRKAALQIAAVVLLILMAFNTYLAIDHLERIQATAARSLKSSGVQAGISRVWQDFTDMETGQRGYLLTDDPAYLQPYVDSKNGIATDFANLRSALANRPQPEQALETQLEALAASKQAEIERTIALRQQGYRHRAFQLVQTNQGKILRSGSLSRLLLVLPGKQPLRRAGTTEGRQLHPGHVANHRRQFVFASANRRPLSAHPLPRACPRTASRT
ncbi:MAG: CHASE3 domain-containing protein, partial [Candidatus Sulfotelmatobacter sp.]